jgi:hypothetical protein
MAAEDAVMIRHPGRLVRAYENNILPRAREVARGCRTDETPPDHGDTHDPSSPSPVTPGASMPGSTERSALVVLVFVGVLVLVLVILVPGI